MAHLASIATAVPSNVIPQDKLKGLARAFLEETDPRLQRVLDVFDHARIDERAFAMPLDWYYEPHGFKDRSEAYVRVGLELAERASREALRRADVRPDEIGGIVLVSTTGIATPSLDARLANALPLPADTVRLPVWGLGCAGGVAGLARANDLANARPDRPVLLVALELCSLALDLARFDKRTLVAVSLFADGCAAAVLEGAAGASRPRGPRLTASASHLFPRTERVMGWDVADTTLDVVFSIDIPALVGREIRGLVEPFLARANDGRRPDHWVLHPGGAKVLDAYATALGLTEHDLRFAARALREHGNMSSPTVLFALEEALPAIRPGERALLASLGPGFASELALLEG